MPEFIGELLVNFGNPNASLFYNGALPGFVNVTRVNTLDIVLVVWVLAALKFCGNINLVVMLDRTFRLIASQIARCRLNVVTGAVLFNLAGLILIM